MDVAEIARGIEEGIALERALRWPEAADHYDRLLSRMDAARAEDLAGVRLRHANALLESHRFEDAQRQFDAALEAAKASGDGLTLARGLLGAGVFAASRDDLRRGEEFLLRSLDAFHRVHGAEGIQGEGWALLNLAAVYGRTKRLDLAFLTFDKARERLFRVENWVGVATAWELQARLRDRLGDGDRAAEDYHEAMSFFAKEGMGAKVEEIRARLGGRRVV